MGTRIARLTGLPDRLSGRCLDPVGSTKGVGAGIIAAAAAIATRNLPMTMASGIASILLFRHFG